MKDTNKNRCPSDKSALEFFGGKQEILKRAFDLIVNALYDKEKWFGELEETLNMEKGYFKKLIRRKDKTVTTAECRLLTLVLGISINDVLWSIQINPEEYSENNRKGYFRTKEGYIRTKAICELFADVER